ncbi:DUF418 domain-containing protein [Paenibacillus urinalis]|uniref:DUF418 domain-containing protein n=1 Tax=Paenibacillus urinalis TaxID=521520 RepID=A0ABY7XBA3_9BACL|nr:DUF418 domain-containing protein [Paenibacillus urinalis]WDH99430.1 DUF418 domain-containing protein [Paenibacillus urinalis]WDI03064.1 DUF418 domain-containing protein [Paenibacillus urinalis]
MRSLAPDLGRGFMLLLIVIAHAPVFLFMAKPFTLTRPLGEHWLDDIVNLVGLLFVDNRAYPMFAALFGYGLAAMAARQQDKGVPVTEVKRLLRRRSWLLIVFGFIHLVFIGGADILAVYGISGLILGWLLFKPERIQRRAIILIGLVYIIIIPVAWVTVYPILTGEELDMGYTPSHTYLLLVSEHFIAFPIMILINLLLYPMLLIITLGVWSAHKRWLDHPERFRPQLKRITIGGISISLIGALPYALTGANMWHPESGLISWFVIVHIITGVAGGLGYTALIALFSISARRIAPRITQALASVGRRSLTFYIYQEAMLVLLLSPVALGLGGVLDSAGVFVIAVLIWFSGVCLAVWLEKRGWNGPIDALMRRLIYRERKGLDRS